ncbi:MAG TPA: cytochrome c oxidase subunit II [Gaiellaceae bacterium]
MRRGSLIQLALFGLVAAAIATAVAVAIPWLPVSAGKEAHRIHFVYWFATAIAIGVFAIVAAVLTYCVVHFRARPDDDSDGPPTHGHTRLEIVWTAIPALLVTSIAIVSAVVLAQNGNAGSHPVKVKVTARQFAWLFTYPNGKSYGSLTLPKDEHAELEITSEDVVHSFWVPQLSQKQDAVPGQVNPLVVTPTRLGTFPVVCTELCGLGHALMRSHVTIVSKADFQKFLKGGQSSGPPGLAVFNTSGCGGCHTFKPAGAAGKVGPDLDDLQASAAKAGRGSEAQFVKESIIDPNAYIAPGYPPNVMPETFKQQIPGAKLDQLVQYLTGAAK